MLSFIWAIIAGLIIGVIAKLVVPGKQDIPLWLTVVLGVAGAIAGNLVATAIGVRDTPGIDWVRHAMQIGAAAGLVFLVAPRWNKMRA